MLSERTFGAERLERIDVSRDLLLFLGLNCSSTVCCTNIPAVENSTFTELRWIPPHLIKIISRHLLQFSRLTSSSNARIVLKFKLRIEPVVLVGEPLVPRLARVVEGLLRSIREVDVGFALQDLQAQSRRRVPGDMAVQEPGARIVGSEGEDEIAVLGQ